MGLSAVSPSLYSFSAFSSRLESLRQAFANVAEKSQRADPEMARSLESALSVMVAQQGKQSVADAEHARRTQPDPAALENSAQLAELSKQRSANLRLAVLMNQLLTRLG
ncbi:MAG: hypothetical protein LBL69_03515 [Zoogloeaceae bacterium]|jgi:predicted kinase|nr:hypothetical protein [Zoogloeaceae bacterium]